MRGAIAGAFAVLLMPAVALADNAVLMDQVHNFWGSTITEDDVTIGHALLNDDATPDAYAWRVLGNGEDAHLALLVVVDSSAYGVQAANITIPVTEGALCSSDIAIEAESFDTAAIEATGMRNIGSTALRIDDGMCDAIRLFWPLGTPHATVDMRMLRN